MLLPVFFILETAERIINRFGGDTSEIGEE